MNITEHLRQAADSDHPDLHRVARVARAQGTRVRRRRQGVAVLGSAAAVAVVAGGLTVTFGGGPDTVGAPATSPSVASTSTPSPAVPSTVPANPEPTLTGRGVVAGLRYAVSAVSQGKADAFAGQQSSDDGYGQLDWTDADGRGVSVISINVQPGMGYVSRCDNPEYLRCRTTHPTPGATLTTYEEHTPTANGVAIRRVADLLQTDEDRVVVSATNGYRHPHGRWDVTRPQPPLDFEQLTEVVSQWWWGATLP